jgi:serine/threonine protein kinase
VKIMHKINHPNCVQLYEMYETPKKLYMVMELLRGRELFDRIVERQSYSESDASTLMTSVLHAIEYLHSIGVVHRDLKPENIIYASPDSNVVKITDFGLAKHRADTDAKMVTGCGTLGYAAPEVLKNEPYGKAVDMWSVGVILYILLCGFPPFSNDHTPKLFRQIKRGEYDFPLPYWENITHSAKDLVQKLLTVNPKRRLTVTQALQHPWIKGKTANTEKFDKTHNERIRLLQAKRTLRRVVRTIIALNRFSAAVENAAALITTEKQQQQQQQQQTTASATPVPVTENNNNNNNNNSHSTPTLATDASTTA